MCGFLYEAKVILHEHFPERRVHCTDESARLVACCTRWGYFPQLCTNKTVGVVFPVEGPRSIENRLLLHEGFRVTNLSAFSSVAQGSSIAE